MSGSRRILVSRQSLEAGRPASSLVPVDRGVHLPVDMCNAGMKRILASGDQKDSIGAEDRDFLSAMGTGPAAHPRAQWSAVRPLSAEIADTERELHVCVNCASTLSLSSALLKV